MCLQCYLKEQLTKRAKRAVMYVMNMERPEGALMYVELRCTTRGTTSTRRWPLPVRSAVPTRIGRAPAPDHTSCESPKLARLTLPRLGWRPTVRSLYMAIAVVAALLTTEAIVLPDHDPAPSSGSLTVGLTPQQQATKNALCRAFYENAGAPNRVSLQSLAANCPGEAL